MKRTTYKVCADYNICGKVSTCLVALAINEEDANRKLEEAKNNSHTYENGYIGNLRVAVEEDDGTEWYYGYTD